MSILLLAFAPFDSCISVAPSCCRLCAVCVCNHSPLSLFLFYFFLFFHFPIVLSYLCTQCTQPTYVTSMYHSLHIPLVKRLGLPSHLPFHPHTVPELLVMIFLSHLTSPPLSITCAYSHDHNAFY